MDKRTGFVSVGIGLAMLAGLGMNASAATAGMGSDEDRKIRALQEQIADLEREVIQLREARPPKCEEDETLLQGYGDFENGRWSHYACVHPDDYVPYVIENDYRNPAISSAVRGSVCVHKRFWYRLGIRAVVSETCTRYYEPPTPI